MNTPHVFGGNEVPASVLSEPRIVSPPSGPPDATWPRIGDVPSNPHNFTSEHDIDNTKKQMEADRDTAGAMRQRAETVQPEPNTLQLPPGQ